MTEEKKAPLEQASADSTAETHQESDQTSEASAALSVINHIDLEAASQLAASAAPSEQQSGQQSEQPAEAGSSAVTQSATTEAVKNSAPEASPEASPDTSPNASSDALSDVTAAASPAAAAGTPQESPAPQSTGDATIQEPSETTDDAAAENTPAPASGGQPPLPPASPFPPTGTSGDDLPVPAASGSQLPAATNDDDEDDDDKEGSGKAMGLMDHLGELRVRIVRCCIAIAVGFFACWAIVDPIFDILVNPLLAVLPKGSHAIYTTLPEGFFARMYIAVVAGVFVSSPVIFYQIWSFIAPGLYEEEKKYIIPIAIMSAVFFICGGAFCYFVVFPYAFSFFVSFATEDIVAMPKVSDYLSFVLKLILAFGIIFEMPLFAFFLARMGVITATMMRKARRYAILGIFIVAAVLTPPDVVSQLLMACPMLVLYEISIWVAAGFGRKPKTEDDEQATSDDAPEGSQKAKAAHPSEKA